MKYNIKTDILSDDRILQEITQEHEGIKTTMLRQVFDTTERQAQEALVKLGWIRPKDKERIKNILLRQIGDTKECPACAASFILSSEDTEDVLDIYRELFKKK